MKRLCFFATMIALTVGLIGVIRGGVVSAETNSAIAIINETTILRTSDAQAEDRAGDAVSISGDTLVVGARSEDGGAGDPVFNAGAVYIYERNQGGTDAWGEVTILRPSNPQVFAYFGSSLSISTDTVVVGVPFAEATDPVSGNSVDGAGAVYVFERNAGGVNNWGEVAILRPPTPRTRAYFGWSVDISNDTLVVGTNSQDNGAFIFERSQNNPTSWGSGQALVASDVENNDYFGIDVAISNDTVVVGSYFADSTIDNSLTQAGAAYVFERNLGGVNQWSEAAKLTATDAQASDFFGSAVSINENTIVIGAASEDGGAGDLIQDAGAAYVYERNLPTADAWGESAILRASDAEEQDAFGNDVTVMNDQIVVGSYLEDGDAGFPDAQLGAAYMFERDTVRTSRAGWSEVDILKASNGGEGDVFGISIALDDDIVIVGAGGADDTDFDGEPGTGATYLFDLSSSPTAVGHLEAADVSTSFSYLVALSLFLTIVTLYVAATVPRRRA